MAATQKIERALVTSCLLDSIPGEISIMGRFEFVAGSDFYDGPANFCTSQSPPAGDNISPRGDIWKGESLLHDTGPTALLV